MESSNGVSHRERSRHEKSQHEGSHRERHHGKKSHCERRHQGKSHHDESRHDHRNEEMEDLKKKYAHILSQMDGEGPKSTTWEMLDDENLPFSEQVKAYTMPDKFKMPCVEKYDRGGDPKAHLEVFREHLILHGTLDEIACRAFPLTLTEVANDWFTGLLLKSVNSFKELGHLFLTQFLATRKRKKNVTCLLTLCQGKEESLKDFMLRFNKEKLEVDSPDEKTMLNALMQGIRADRPLMADIAKTTRPMTLTRFMRKTEEYINQEELVRTLLKAQKLEDQARQESKKALTAPKQMEDKNPQKAGKKSGPLFTKSEPRDRKSVV